MTLQQQAYGLIDSLPDDSVQVVIQVMRRMMPKDSRALQTDTKVSNAVSSRKMKAYLRMQKLRKETSGYDISEGQREAAINEKFGTFE